MTRSEVIKEMARRRPSMFATEIEKIVDIINDAMNGFISSGRRIELRTFGIFAVKNLAPKVASSPRGGKISLPARTSVKFKPGKSLLAKVNG
ncbi:MAG: integration host factor subunit beta [Alphaproteobacteria bacterium]|nr:integration host factor subunit beta [Alphaproteobacteria bacterium]